MKKGIALLLALLLTLGCVSHALAELDLSKYVSNPEETITIEWLAGHDTDAIPEGDTVVAWLEQKFNVKLNVWFVERENYDELLTARIAGGEIPDVFMLQNAQQFSKWIKQGVVAVYAGELRMAAGIRSRMLQHRQLQRP